MKKPFRLIAHGFSSVTSVPTAEDSIAYRMSMFCRPEMLRLPGLRTNSCSFIGSVAAPVRKYAWDREVLGVYTFIHICSPSNRAASSSPGSRPLQILLSMKDQLAEIALNYLKPEDFIYVSGSLGSYKKGFCNGKSEICYKIFVDKLNYCHYRGQRLKSKEQNASILDDISASSVSSSEDVDYSDRSDKLARDRLHLLQVFFASPYEWWDNRNSKKNPQSPDFVHKNTKERIWLRPDDPPWIRRQLDLYDSKAAKANEMNSTRSRCGDRWKIADYL